MVLNLQVSKISACKEILNKLLEEKNYSSLKECFYDLYGTTLFRAIPVGIRNSILYEHFNLKNRRSEAESFSSQEATFLYLQDLNESLTEEKVTLKYFFRLREAYEDKEISYKDSLELISKIERDFLSSSEDVYNYFISKKWTKEAGEI